MNQDESDASRRIKRIQTHLVGHRGRLVAAFGANELKRAQIRANSRWIRRRTGLLTKTSEVLGDFGSLTDTLPTKLPGEIARVKIHFLFAA